MFDVLFSKKKLGDDEDNILVFAVLFEDANTVNKLKKLCVSNPKKCIEIKGSFCKKFLKISNFKTRISDNCCSLVKKILDIKKDIIGAEANIKDLSIDPKFLKHLRENPDETLSEFLNYNGIAIVHKTISRKFSFVASKSLGSSSTIKIKR